MFNVASQIIILSEKTCIITVTSKRWGANSCKRTNVFDLWTLWLFGLLGTLLFWYTFIKQTLLESINPKTLKMMQQIAAPSLNSQTEVVIRNF